MNIIFIINEYNFFLFSSAEEWQQKERLHWVKKDEDPMQLVSGDNEKAWTPSLQKQGEFNVVID